MSNEVFPSESDPSDDSRRHYLRLRESLPMSVYSQISEISLYFERVWEKERVLSIEDCLALVEEDVRLELFERLLEVDVSLGIERDAAISPDDYKKRFPQWTRSVDAVYERLTRQSGVVNKMRVGRTIGNYRIDRVLGKGGMGVVYKAFDQPFDRSVAIKYLLPSQTDREESVKLFRREMKLLGQVPTDSPFAKAYHYARDGSFDYFVMEYVDGENLAQLFKNGDVDRRKTATYVLKIAEGLETIHRLGIIHRDVKPENVMLDKDGRIRILDLGLGALRRFDVASKSAETDSKLRSSIVGTFAYMSPESYQTPESVDSRADLYSLGGTFFYMLTGKPPIVWRSPASSHTSISLKDYFLREKIAVCDDVLAIISRLLEPNVERRYQSASDVVRDLNAFLLKYSPEETKKRVRRTTALFVAVVVAACAVVCWEISERRAAIKSLRSAQIALQKDAYDDALQKLNSIKIANLSNARKREFFTSRGDASFELGKYADALEDFNEALKFVSDDVDALAGAARCETALGEFDSAKAFVIRAVKSEPENVAMRRLDGEISVKSLESGSWESREEFARCVEALDVLDDADDDAETRYWRARVYHRQMRDDLALAELNASVAQNDEYEETRRFRANLLINRANKSSKFESTRSVALKAVKDFEYLLPEKKPERQISTLYKRAFCYFLAEESEAFANACDELQRAVNDYKGDTSLKLIYAEIKTPFLTSLAGGRYEAERDVWTGCVQKVETALRKDKDENDPFQTSSSEREDLIRIRDFVERAARRFGGRTAETSTDLVDVWLDDSNIGGNIKVSFDLETPSNDASVQNEVETSEQDDSSLEMERDAAVRLFEQMKENGATSANEVDQKVPTSGTLR